MTKLLVCCVAAVLATSAIAEDTLDGASHYGESVLASQDMSSLACSTLANVDPTSKFILNAAVKAGIVLGLIPGVLIPETLFVDSINTSLSCQDGELHLRGV